MPPYFELLSHCCHPSKTFLDSLIFCSSQLTREHQCKLIPQNLTGGFVYVHMYAHVMLRHPSHCSCKRWWCAEKCSNVLAETNKRALVWQRRHWIDGFAYLLLTKQRIPSQCSSQTAAGITVVESWCKMWRPAVGNDGLRSYSDEMLLLWTFTTQVGLQLKTVIYCVWHTVVNNFGKATHMCHKQKGNNSGGRLWK